MKLEQAARQSFETWWEREGQEFLYALNTTTDDDIKLVAEVAWKNGAYCAEQAEQEPVYAFRRKGQDSFCTCDKERYEELADKPWMFEVTTFYAAPLAQQDTHATHVVRTKDLTDDEIYTLYSEPCSDREMIDFARAVIEKFKEKNRG